MSGGWQQRKALLAVGFLVVGMPMHAQEPRAGEVGRRWAGQFAILGANAAVGAFTAGIIQELRGGSFGDGFVRGALGGSLVYAGKRLAVQRWVGAGLLGREVAATGSSIVRNALEGLPSLACLRLPLPVLPLRIDITGGELRQTRLRIDVYAAGWLTYGFLTPDRSVDFAQSLSSGAPVFRVRANELLEDGGSVDGMTASRTVFLKDPFGDLADPALGDVAAHERVHVLQQDFILMAWSEPLSNALLEFLAGGRHIRRYVVVDSIGWLVTALRRWTTTPSTARHFPTEWEADLLSRP